MNVSEFGGILRTMSFCRCLASVLCPVHVITETQVLMMARHKGVHVAVSQRLVQSAVVHGLQAYVR